MANNNTDNKVISGEEVNEHFGQTSGHEIDAYRRKSGDVNQMH